MISIHAAFLSGEVKLLCKNQEPCRSLRIERQIVTPKEKRRRGIPTPLKTKRKICPALPGQFFVDDGLEAFKGLGAGEEAPVDEECRSAGDAGLLPVGHVLLNISLELAGGIALFELVHVEADIGRVLEEVIIREV